MISVDSSVAIAAFGEWHELNALACDVLDQGASLPVDALLETYSVLTGFPPPYRATPEIVARWIEDRFAAILPAPDVDQHRELIRTLARAERAGGAVYDALIALTAKLAGATIVTADRRALATYELVGVEARLL